MINRLKRFESQKRLMSPPNKAFSMRLAVRAWLLLSLGCASAAAFDEGRSAVLAGELEAIGLSSASIKVIFFAFFFGHSRILMC